VNHTSLTRRLLAGGASLAIGAAGALAFAAPASAQEAAVPYTAETISERGVSVTGAAECDPETYSWTVSWTVTNTSASELATIVDPDPAVTGFAHNDAFGPNESKTGTQSVDSGTESATFEATLRWANEIGEEEFLSDSATVELGDCPSKPKDPEPEPPAEPAIVVFFTCELFGFIIDNSEGEAGATVTFTPDRTATHGHASGFSYTVDEENNVEIIIEEGAGIETVVGEADSENPVVLGPFPAGADPHTHAFEAVEGLTITVELALDGEPVELKDNVITWSDKGLDCVPDEGDDNGEGGELPVTGASTTLFAGGAVLLLAVGGGLYLIARRRRVTFSA
jgi:LPXTG-motif cell wall-anchored protein